MKYPFLNLADSNAHYMEQLVAAAERVIRSGYYVGGPEVKALEEDLKKEFQAPYCVAVSNGLDALRIILRVYRELGLLQQGDEVIIPANTYVASFLAISDNGLIPVTVDADASTLNLDTSLIENAITERTRAIMPVHLYGRTCWDEKIKQVADKYNLLIIEDCAQAYGAEADISGLHDSQKAGALGHAAGLSFYPTKNLGALGDAGAIITHDEKLAQTARAIANYGSDRRYHNLYQGWNCRLDPIQAAMLRVKIAHDKEEKQLRQHKARLYDKHIINPLVIKPALPENDNICVWHQYVIRIIDGKRDKFQQELTRLGVGTDIHYPTPAHLQPCYRDMKHGALPVTEQLAHEVLSLPIARGTSENDIVEIASLINSIKI